MGSSRKPDNKGSGREALAMADKGVVSAFDSATDERRCGSDGRLAQPDTATRIAAKQQRRCRSASAQITKVQASLTQAACEDDCGRQSRWNRYEDY
jgi:hypothetical protein